MLQSTVTSHQSPDFLSMWTTVPVVSYLVCMNQVCARPQLQDMLAHTVHLVDTVTASAGASHVSSQQPGLASELPQLAAPLSAYLAVADQIDAAPDSLALQTSALHVGDPFAGGPSMGAAATAAIAMAPHLPARPRLYQLSESALLSATGASMLGMLTQLNLHGSALKRIEVDKTAISTQ